MQEESKTVMMALSVFVLVYVLVYYLFFSFSGVNSITNDSGSGLNQKDNQLQSGSHENVINLTKLHERNIQKQLLNDNKNQESDNNNDNNLVDEENSNGTGNDETSNINESNEDRTDIQTGSSINQTEDEKLPEENEIDEIINDFGTGKDNAKLYDMLNGKGMIRGNDMGYDVQKARLQDGLSLYTGNSLPALDEVIEIKQAIEFGENNYLYPLSYEGNIYELIVPGIEILDFNEKNIIKDEHELFGQRLIILKRDDWNNRRVVLFIYIQEYDDYWYMNLDYDQYDSDLKSSLKKFFEAIYDDSNI